MQMQFYHYQIALIGLSAKNGEDRFEAYNFVRNMYNKFAPAHRNESRILQPCYPMWGSEQIYPSLLPNWH